MRQKTQAQKNPPQDGDLVFGWDSAPGDHDCTFLFSNLAAYVITKITNATSSAAGFMSAAFWTKLNALPSNTEFDNCIYQVQQQPLGIAIATPANGYIGFFLNPCGKTIVHKAFLKLAAGTCTVDVMANGGGISSLTGIAVTTTPLEVDVPDPGHEMITGTELGITISDVAGAAGLIVSIRSDVEVNRSILTP